MKRRIHKWFLKHPCFHVSMQFVFPILVLGALLGLDRLFHNFAIELIFIVVVAFAWVGFLEWSACGKGDWI